MKTADTTAPERDASPADAFPLLAAPALEAAVARLTALRTSADEEDLHKLRVALRRLRSLFWAYRPSIEPADYRSAVEALGRLAAAAGRTRNWDVAITLLGKCLSEHAPQARVMETARAATLGESRRDILHDYDADALRSLVGQTAAVLAPARANCTLSAFAADRVAKAHRTLDSRMKRALHGPADQYAAYHEVRKKGKRLRYLLELFEPFLSRREIERIDKLKVLQDRFGALNDVVATVDLLTVNRTLFDATFASHALRWLDNERSRRMHDAHAILRAAVDLEREHAA